MEFVSPFDQSAIRRVFADAFRVRDIFFPATGAELAELCTKYDQIPQVSADAQMLEAMHLLMHHPFILVEELGSSIGYVTARCLNQLAARMWLFGLVGLIERHFDVAIEICHSEADWQKLLSESRLTSARTLQAERLRQGQPAELLSCLQISDKIAILLADPRMAAELGYKSKRHMKQGMKALALLRNHLAHHQDIFPHCMEAALGMADRLDSIMEGSRLRLALQKTRQGHPIP